MCGICGIFHYGPASGPAERDAIEHMTAHMRRRGPDASNTWLSDDAPVGFGHRRLAIIDLSESGRQPLWSHDRNLVITYNGEIYNYQALRAELQAAGVTFATHTDTEVILELYRHAGPEGFARLRGMFAFTIWDIEKRQLIMARDPFGIKPLYVYDKDGVLRFASQVKALLAAGDIDTTPDPAGHVGFAIWGHVPEPFTLYRHISAFPAGHYQIIEEGGPLGKPKAFACLLDTLRRAEETRGERADWQLEELHDAIADSVAHHHVADVPVGVFLSAGKDSSVLAALSARVKPSGLHTFTLGFNEYQGTPLDEAPIAEETAALLHANHTTEWVTANHFAECYEDILDVMDQPTIDGVNSYFVAKYAAASGLKVALSGLGGDELFGGYPSFTDVPRAAALCRFIPPAGVGLPVRRLTQNWIGRFTSPKYAGLFEYGSSIAGAYLLRRALHMPWEIGAFMDQDLVRSGLDRLQLMGDLQQKCEGLSDPYLAVMALELTVFMRDQLLRNTDWATMAHSLELRTPLVDWTLFTALAPMLASPSRPRKNDLAAIARAQLPATVFNRPKSGFAIPVRDWLSQGQSPAAPRGLRGFYHLIHQKFAA